MKLKAQQKWKEEKQGVHFGFCFKNKRQISFESFTNTNSHHITRQCLPKISVLISYSIQIYSSLLITPRFQPKVENEDTLRARVHGSTYNLLPLKKKQNMLPK